MKISFYPSFVHDNTLFINAGFIVDKDDEGSLEEFVSDRIHNGQEQIALILKGMYFLHESLIRTLISTSTLLNREGKTLILIDTPWFVKELLKLWKMDQRFIFHKHNDYSYELIENSSQAFERVDLACKSILEDTTKDF